MGYVLALALFLLAQRHPTVSQPAEFHSVIDLTYPNAVESAAIQNAITGSDGLKGPAHANVSRRQPIETRLDAPAALGTGLWAPDQIPPERLVGPLVVLDVRDSVRKNPNYQLSVIDIANFERLHGEVPPGSVVMALTGISVTQNNQENNSSPEGPVRSAGYSADAAKFLIEGRNVVALGTDSGSVDSGLSKDSTVSRYTLSRDAYLIENVADLDRAPTDGGIVMVAPLKLENRTSARVRILALAR